MADSDDVSESTGVPLASQRRDQRFQRGPPTDVTLMLDEIGTARPAAGRSDLVGQPDFRTVDDRDGDLESLRRDISRLEGKVDALLAALDVEVEDGDE